MSSKGQAIRTYVRDISVIGRNTQGVRIIRLDEGETVANFAVVPKSQKQQKPPMDGMTPQTEGPMTSIKDEPSASLPNDEQPKENLS